MSFGVYLVSLLVLLVSCNNVLKVACRLQSRNVSHPKTQIVFVAENDEAYIKVQDIRSPLNDWFDSISDLGKEVKVTVCCKENEIVRNCETPEFCFIVYFSKCAFEVSHHDEMFKKFQLHARLFILVCWANRTGEGTLEFHDENAAKETIKKWRNGNHTKVLIYDSNITTLTSGLERVVPYVNLRNNCFYVEIRNRSCTFNVATKMCEKLVYIHLQPGYLKLISDPCAPNVTESCLPEECACEKSPWQNGSCSSTCGEGMQTPWRNVLHNPTCNKTDTPEPCENTIPCLNIIEIQNSSTKTVHSKSPSSSKTSDSTSSLSKSISSESRRNFNTTRHNQPTTEMDYPTITTISVSEKDTTASIYKPSSAESEIKFITTSDVIISKGNPAKTTNSTAFAMTTRKNLTKRTYNLTKRTYNSTSTKSITLFMSTSESHKSHSKTQSIRTRSSSVSPVGKNKSISHTSISTAAIGNWTSTIKLNEKGNDKEEQERTMWVIIGSIVVLILFVAIIFVALFLILFHRRRKRPQRRALLKKQGEKRTEMPYLRKLELNSSTSADTSSELSEEDKGLVVDLKAINDAKLKGQKFRQNESRASSTTVRKSEKKETSPKVTVSSSRISSNKETDNKKEFSAKVFTSRDPTTSFAAKVHYAKQSESRASSAAVRKSETKETSPKATISSSPISSNKETHMKKEFSGKVLTSSDPMSSLAAKVRYVK